MLPTGAFIHAMIPLYIMSIIGFTARKIKILNTHANYVITQLMLYITLPALILFSLNLTFSLDLLSTFVWLISMSFFVLTISILVGKWLRRKSILPQSQKSVYESLIIFGNQGFIGFAISYIVLGNEGIIYLTFLIFAISFLFGHTAFIFSQKNKQQLTGGIYV